jgi:hypothetical protein
MIPVFLPWFARYFEAVVHCMGSDKPRHQKSTKALVFSVFYGFLWLSWEALDKKTPLLRAQTALVTQVNRVAKFFQSARD